MKRFKKLGILLGVLAAVCAATFALTQYEQEQERIQNSDAVILQIPGDTVTGLSWEYSSGEGLAFVKEDGLWKYEEDEHFPVSEEKIGEILSGFENFGVTFLIEDVQDYSQYGLEEPEATIRIGTEETAYDIRLGAFSTMDQQRYVDIGDGNVYLVAEDPKEYVSSALSDMIRNDDITGFENALDALYAGSFTAEAPEGREEIRFTLHLDNETFPTLEVILYRYDGSECLAVINGESVSLIPRASAMELVEAVQTIVLDNR